jgi:hypothetical protein
MAYEFDSGRGMVKKYGRVVAVDGLYLSVKEVSVTGLSVSTAQEKQQPSNNSRFVETGQGSCQDLRSRTMG